MIPTALNSGLVFVLIVLIVLNVLQFVALPIFLLPLDPVWGWILVLPALATTTYWSVIHEAIHGHLLPDKRLNDRVGRALCVFFGSPFQLLRLGHLIHHRFNRTPIQRTEVSSEPERATVGEIAWYYFQIFGGLYFFELLASLFALLPNRVYETLAHRGFGKEASDGRTMWRAAQTQLTAEPGRSRMRVDGLLICLLFGTSFWLYGEYCWMLALALFARGFLVSFFDNAYHYGNQLEDIHAGYNLRLPAVAARAFLNFNLHSVHHRYPNMPWTELPTLFEKDGDVYHLDYLHAAARQLSGVIPEPAAAKGEYDFRRPDEKAEPKPKVRRSTPTLTVRRREP